MKFSAKEDIEAPIETVFEMASDFDSFERSAMRRGAEVQRIGDVVQNGLGLMWDVAFDMRGRRREMRLEVVEYEQPGSLSIAADSPSITGSFDVELISLSRSRTRMSVQLELKPQNLSARLLIQSLKLAKANLTKRFKLRVAEYSKEMEDRFKRTA